MKNSFGLTVIAAVVFLVLISAALAAATPGRHSATVTTARTGLGTVVADGGGRTLYLFRRHNDAQRLLGHLRRLLATLPRQRRSGGDQGSAAVIARHHQAT